ncbi:MAG: DUF58 domain-containing protein [Halobacteriaceae archaeon]
MSGDRRLTRRGAAVVVVVVVGFAMGWLFGGRSLNAVVVPGAVLLGVSWLGIRRVTEPRVDRDAPGYGFPDETAEVELSVAGDRSVSVTVSDAVPEGLVADPTFHSVSDGNPLRYELGLRERGIFELGPVTVTATDVFGLWKVTFTAPVTDEVVVFPRIRPLYESAGIVSGYVGLTDEREQFDSIREYQRGDDLRDVNWKASAKRAGDLVVTEYAGEGAERNVLVGVDRGPNPDATAEAAATLVVHMLDAGLSVGLITPRRSIGPGAGNDHRRDLLTALAAYDGDGPQPDMEAADVEVRPGEGGARVRAGRETHQFEDIALQTKRSAGVTG